MSPRRSSAGAAIRRSIAAALAVVATAGGLATDRPAEACGGFGRQGSSPPSVAVERVLLVHDEERGVEHFVREVAFADVRESFGFVVPTPSKPSVAKVDDLDWSRLERTFPFAPPASGGIGSRGDGRLGGAGVKVLEHKRVGSFASYVLRATDGDAMRKWLDDNRFETTAASRAWLDHYIALDFHFVALRFEPQLAKETRRSRGDFDLDRGGAETLRISFETPVPFYPYREPDQEGREPDQEGREPDQGGLASDRLLSLWVLTSSAKVPVALRVEAGQGPTGARSSWVRPWREGLRPAALEPETTAVFGKKTWKAVAPGGNQPLVLQVFEDQKRSRRGFGDVVLVPEKATPLDADALAKRRRLFALLDPGGPGR